MEETDGTIIQDVEEPFAKMSLTELDRRVQDGIACVKQVRDAKVSRKQHQEEFKRRRLLDCAAAVTWFVIVGMMYIVGVGTAFLSSVFFALLFANAIMVSIVGVRALVLRKAFILNKEPLHSHAWFLRYPPLKVFDFQQGLLVIVKIVVVYVLFGPTASAFDLAHFYAESKYEGLIKTSRNEQPVLIDDLITDDRFAMLEGVQELLDHWNVLVRRANRLKSLAKRGFHDLTDKDRDFLNEFQGHRAYLHRLSGLMDDFLANEEPLGMQTPDDASAGALASLRRETRLVQEKLGIQEQIIYRLLAVADEVEPTDERLLTVADEVKPTDESESS